MRLTFLGATQTVTGSKYLVEADDAKILVDCGLFQGFKTLRLRNWAPFPIDPKQINAIVLTHAHLDHSGYLPLLVRNGFKGKIYCTQATFDLCKLLLPDSGHLQEEEAEYARKRGYSKHSPPLPLYTVAEAEESLKYFYPINLEEETELAPNLKLNLLHSGHLLGSAFVSLKRNNETLLFSGDLGRPHDIIILPPKKITHADYLILESTYGNRRHATIDIKQTLSGIINRTIKRNGVILIPSFAVGRAQALLYYIHLLKADKAIPDIPVYLNSPMAADASVIFRTHHKEHRLSPEQCHDMYSVAKIINTVEDSKRLNEKRGPMIIISASGMATGGRIIHHLEAFAPDPNNTILFVGFQAGGTRGEAMVHGAEEVKIHGKYVPIHAEVVLLDSFSAHADWSETLEWLSYFETPPRNTFITHGEPVAADALRHRIQDVLNWRCHVPEYLESVDI